MAFSEVLGRISTEETLQTSGIGDRSDAELIPQALRSLNSFEAGHTMP